MKPMHVCIPVLKRYDLLHNLLESLRASTVEPAGAYVIDNGRNAVRVNAAVSDCQFPVIVWTPEEPMGIAESWNWFLDHVPEERIITNDDVVFGPQTLAKFAATEKDIVWAAEAGFSCFIIRDSCVKKIGLFDESISPGYGYWEDEDYAMRLNRKGKGPEFASCGDVVCGVEHLHSKTLEVATPVEMEEHHRRFWIAQHNYIEKWGLQREYAKGLVEGMVK
jgi:GT2 family glycosyltransferase